MARVLGGDAAAGAEALHRGGRARGRRAGAQRRPPAASVADARSDLPAQGQRRARRLLAQALQTARARAALGELPFVLFLLARDQATSDRWAVAEATYRGSDRPRARDRSAHRSRLRPRGPRLAAGPARSGARRRRALAAEAIEVCVELGARLYEVWATAALGELELGLGDAARAAEHFEDQRAAAARARDHRRRSVARGRARRRLRPARPRQRRRAGRGPVHDRRGGQGTAVVTGPRAALPRARGRRRRPCRAVRAGAPPPRAHARRVRDRTHAARVRPAPAASPQSRPRSRAAPGGGRHVRAPRRPPVGRARAHRAGRDRRDACAGATRARSTS